MSWETLEDPGPQRPTAPPHNGVRVAACLSPVGGPRTRDRSWIRIGLGKMAAARASMTLGEHKVSVLIGEGEDAGKIGILWDQAKGRFKAKRQRNGTYAIAITSSACEGRFATDFEPFTISQVKAVPGPNGNAMLTFVVPDGFILEGD